MLYRSEESRIDITGGKVTVLSFGTGDKPLVMIHGLRLSEIDGSVKAVAWYYRIFAKEYRVYMIGRKDNISEDCTVRDIAEDTAEAMEKLGISGAYLFGASQGGMIAQYIAIEHPELVKKMVLGVTLSRNNDTAQTVISEWIRLSESKGLSAVAEDYIKKGYSERYLKKYGRFMPMAVKMQKFMPAERFRILAQACLSCETYDRLDKIKCPVLVLGGGEDRIVTAEASEEIAERLGCECYIYEGLGHEAYNEAADFNRRIYDFFAK